MSDSEERVWNEYISSESPDVEKVIASLNDGESDRNSVGGESAVLKEREDVARESEKESD